MRLLLVFFIIICSAAYAQLSFNGSDQFERELIQSINLQDSSNSLLIKNTLPHKHSFGNSVGQYFTGTVLSVIFPLPSLLAAFTEAMKTHGKSSGEEGLLALSLAAYLFGAGTGVYWVAHAQNRDLSYWGTIACAAAGGAVGTGLIGILATQYRTIPTWQAIIVFTTPVMGSMIYAGYFSDWPEESTLTSEILHIQKNILSHKDFIEQEKLFNIELLQIRLL